MDLSEPDALESQVEDRSAERIERLLRVEGTRTVEKACPAQETGRAFR